MKRLVITALAGVLAVAVPAQAHHKPGHDKPNTHSNHSPSSKGRCGVVNRGWNVTGDNATFAVTKNADGTYDGTVTLITTGGNSHAHRSGVNSTDTTPETFNLDDTKIIFENVTDGDDVDTEVGPADVLATDTVKLIGKIPYAKKGSKKKPCADRGFGTDRYGDVKIRQAVVHREPPAPAPVV